MSSAEERAGREMDEALVDISLLCNYAYQNGFHELGYNPVARVMDRLAELEHQNATYCTLIADLKDAAAKVGQPPFDGLTDGRINEFLGELDGYCDRTEVVRKWFGGAVVTKAESPPDRLDPRIEEAVRRNWLDPNCDCAMCVNLKTALTKPPPPTKCGQCGEVLDENGMCQAMRDRQAELGEPETSRPPQTKAVCHSEACDHAASLYASMGTVDKYPIVHESMRRAAAYLQLLAETKAAPSTERYEAALRSIAASSCCGGCQEAKRVALAALSPAKERIRPASAAVSTGSTTEIAEAASPETSSPQFGGRKLHCSDCEATVWMEYTDATQRYLSIGNMDGWTAPPNRCQKCSKAALSETGETNAPRSNCRCGTCSDADLGPDPDPLF